METDRRRRPDALTPREVAWLATQSALEHGGHVPTLIVEGSMRHVIGHLADLPETHEGRVQRLFSIGVSLGRIRAVGKLEQVFFISEGWLSMGEEGRPPRMLPSQDPDRKEVLFVFHCAVERQQTGLVLFEMVRDSGGHLVELREARLPGEAEGRVESPLLDAFVDGFRLGMARLN